MFQSIQLWITGYWRGELILASAYHLISECRQYFVLDLWVVFGTISHDGQSFQSFDYGLMQSRDGKAIWLHPMIGHEPERSLQLQSFSKSQKDNFAVMLRKLAQRLAQDDAIVEFTGVIHNTQKWVTVCFWFGQFIQAGFIWMASAIVIGYLAVDQGAQPCAETRS